MRNASWLALTLAVAAVTPITVTTLIVVKPAWGQTIRDDDVPGIMARARAQMAQIRQRLERAERAGRNQDGVAAVADMKRVLDEVSPFVDSMVGNVEQQEAAHAELDAWRAEYTAASENYTKDAGAFFLMMSQRWKELSPQVQSYADETRPATFEELVNDRSIAGFGMPKTLAAVRALDTYLVEIESNPQFPKNKDNPNVASDLAQARQSRAEAVAKLADAARSVLEQATVQRLDQAGRDRVMKMLESDIPYALAGSPRIEEVQARARALIVGHSRDESTTAPSDSTDYLTTLADRVWPIYAGRYATSSGDPMAAGRGSLVEFRNARVISPDQMSHNDADLVLLVNDRPVVCVFDPVVKQHVTNILAETGSKALPSENATVIGIVRGLGTVNFVRQPGSTPASTNPTGGEGDASPQNSPTLQPRDGVAIDVLAIHAGPVAIGVDPTPNQRRAAP